jgi:hypothetical protein
MWQSSWLLKRKANIFLETKIILGLIFLINMIENPELLDCQSPIAFYDSNYPWTLNMNYGTLCHPEQILGNILGTLTLL